MQTLLLLAVLGANFSQVRKVDTCPTGSTLIGGTCVRSNPVGAGFTTVMPVGVDTPAFSWSAATPTVGQLGTGSTVACTAAKTPVTNKSPFCPTGAFPPAGCQTTAAMGLPGGASYQGFHFGPFGGNSTQLRLGVMERDMRIKPRA